MVVIAIIGILSAIAVPSYKTYVIKARVNQTLALVPTIKTEIEEFYQLNGRFPTSSSEVNYTKSNVNEYIENISYYGCAQSNIDRFTITFTDKVTGVSGNGIVFTVIEENEIFKWGCRTADSPRIDRKYIPSNCIDGGTLFGCTSIGPPSL